MNALVRRPSKAELAELAQACALLESPGLAVQLANLLGAPIEYLLLRQLPRGASALVDRAARKAVESAFDTAVRTLADDRPRRPSLGLHRAAVAGTGAVGGFFGLAGLVVELPLTTTAMLRSIADVARSEGESPSRPDTRMACLEVLALGGPGHGDDGAESGYFATRAALAQQITAAARHLASGAAAGGAPALVRAINGIASRFAIPVSQKAVAQAAPFIGAASGAALNLVFMTHFQRVARGHFVVRRLERQHGAAVIRAAYAELRGAR